MRFIFEIRRIIALTTFAAICLDTEKILRKRSWKIGITNFYSRSADLSLFPNGAMSSKNNNNTKTNIIQMLSKVFNTVERNNYPLY